MAVTPDRIMCCPRCKCERFRIIVPGASPDMLCDVECAECGDVFHPADKFNRVPSEYFRELKAEDKTPWP